MAAQQADTAAAGVVAEGEAQVAAAVERERAANEAAATSIRTVIEAVQLMTMTPPAQQAHGPTAGPAAVAPAGGPQLEAGEDGWYDDTVAAAGPVASAPPEDPEDVGRDLVGGFGGGLWVAGPGLAGDLLALSPFEADQQMAEDIDEAHDWLEDWWGADPESEAYRGAETAVGVATAVTSGVGLGRAAAGGVLRLAAKPVTAGAVGATPATSAINARNLHGQLSAEQIAGGHAFEKHVLKKQEFPEVTTREEFASTVEDVMLHGEVRVLRDGPTAYWHGDTFVVRNPGALDGGSAFKPTDGRSYFLEVD